MENAKSTNKKITIIGGSGFVGTNLCRELKRTQCEFEIIDIKMSNQYPEHCKIADVREINCLRKAITGDVVINLAAAHRDDIQDKSEYTATNVDGAENIATVCTEKGITKIIFTSTVAVYGFATPGTDENGQIHPFNEYGHTKFQAEQRLIKWKKLGENSLIIVRPTVIFGEGNRGNVYNLFKQISKKHFLMIGPGNNKKSMAYIGNIIAFLMACISTNQKFGIFNYVDTPDMTINELVLEVKRKLHGSPKIGIRLPKWFGIMIGYFADRVAKITGKNLSISLIRIQKFTTSSQFSTAKSTLECFEPPFRLIDGIHRTLHYEFIEHDKNNEVFYTE